MWGGGIPLPSRIGGLGERRELPQRGPGAERRPKTNLVHFVAARRTLIAKDYCFSSYGCRDSTHTAKHEQQKCDHVYIHTPYTRAFFQTINLQSAGCGQARGVKPKAEHRGGTV